jgi:glutaredoxin
MSRLITLFTKPNCALCDKALEQIELARQEVQFELVQINILDDLETYERYKHDIPVLHLNGVEIFRHRLSFADLLKKLRAV